MKKLIPAVVLGVFVLVGVVLHLSTVNSTQGEVAHTTPPPSTPVSAFTSTSTPALTDTADGTLAYHNSTFHFHLMIPRGYPATEYKEDGGAFTVAFQDPNTNQGFEVYVTPYSDMQITPERFKTDEPSGVYIQPTDIIVDGARATMFFGHNPIMGDTREVWFIRGGYLYEVTTYKTLDEWLATIMATWRFE